MRRLLRSQPRRFGFGQPHRARPRRGCANITWGSQRALKTGTFYLARKRNFLLGSDTFPKADFTPAARAALARSLTAANIQQEVRYLNAAGRATFERPYGLAWLLQLSAEMKEWDDPQAREWASALEPLAQASVARISGWLPKLSYPIRTGEHNNTAFSLGLMLDYARAAKNASFEALLTARIRDYYLKDKACPLAYEPSGEDFLSPCLAEADAVRRVLAPAEFDESTVRARRKLRKANGSQ